MKRFSDANMSDCVALFAVLRKNVIVELQLAVHLPLPSMSVNSSQCSESCQT